MPGEWRADVVTSWRVFHDTRTTMPYNDIAMRYMLRFACIGSDCENHCCWGWRIIIDQANYEKVKLATRHSEKERILVRARHRVEQYLSNLVAHYWIHWRQVDSPNLLVHMLRLLGELSVGKFLLFSHPDIQKALDEEKLTQPLETDEQHAPDPLIETLDRVAVEVFYKTSAFIEHGELLKNMEKALEKNGLNSLAGAVCLARF